MSWEREALAEIRADENKYFREIMDDFLVQAGKEAGGELGSMVNDFINYLVFRMYYEGNPAREPIISLKRPYCGKLDCDRKEECPA